MSSDKLQFIYAVEHPLQPGVFKIGRASSAASLVQRIKSHSGILLTPVKVIRIVSVFDSVKAEKWIHTALSNLKVDRHEAPSNQRELFRCPQECVETMLDTLDGLGY